MQSQSINPCKPERMTCLGVLGSEPLLTKAHVLHRTNLFNGPLLLANCSGMGAGILKLHGIDMVSCNGSVLKDCSMNVCICSAEVQVLGQHFGSDGDLLLQVQLCLWIHSAEG